MSESTIAIWFTVSVMGVIGGWLYVTNPNPDGSTLWQQLMSRYFPQNIMSPQSEAVEPEPVVADVVAPEQPPAAMTIAEPQSDPNSNIAFAEHIAIIARLVKAGKVGQTDAIKIGLGIPPGSGSPRYQNAKQALQAELARLDPQPVYQVIPGVNVEEQRADLGLS